VKAPRIHTRAGQYTWYQVLALAVSIAAYLMGQVVVAVVFLAVGTICGIVAAMLRLREAKAIRGQVPRNRRRR
jgi:hypothetical protein